MTNPNPTGPTTTDPSGPATQGQQVPESPVPSADANPADTEQESSNSEAAKYRVERNEARTERDALAGRVTAMQRRECEAAVADLLEQPTDLWDLGQASAADFYSDTDELNHDDLRAAAAALVESRPGLAKQKKFDGPRNWGQSSEPVPTGGSSSWDQVVKGR